ncbi:hypothetical protein ACQKLP_02975 [Chitinophaga sp. NPDC101104]|uniref:hypothetical protein n=1 Tax=Chitinophaga sp. NPDC101104 TaxID=3390561 RepID=UPI003CFC539B
MILEFRRQQHSVSIEGPDLPGAPFTATLDYQFNAMPVILENANGTARVTICNRPDCMVPIVTDAKNDNRTYPLLCRNWEFHYLELRRPDEIIETFWYPDGVLCFFRDGELVARLSPIKPATLTKSLIGNSRKTLEFECLDGTNIALLLAIYLYTLAPHGDH